VTVPGSVPIAERRRTPELNRSKRLRKRAGLNNWARLLKPQYHPGLP